MRSSDDIGRQTPRTNLQTGFRSPEPFPYSFEISTLDVSAAEYLISTLQQAIMTKAIMFPGRICLACFIPKLLVSIRSREQN